MSAGTVTANASALSKLNNLNSMRNNFDEFVCEIGELEPKWVETPRSDGTISREMNGFVKNGKLYRSGKRFLYSLCSRFGFSRSVFKLFTPDEVFARIHKVDPRSSVKVITEGDKALSVISPQKAYVDMDSMMRTLTRRPHAIKRVDYKDGVITTTHEMKEQWNIRGNEFVQMFTLSSPIDGYGLPNIVLSLKRVSSDSYLVADTKVFKSEVQLGGKNSDKPEIPLMRAIQTFNNEEGFQALRSRLTSAEDTVASIAEVRRAYMSLKQALNMASHRWTSIVDMFSTMTGSVASKYGIATEDSISIKKARLLPMDCTVADLIYFNMEVASLPDLTISDKPIHQWTGTTISAEYDLEGSEIPVTNAPKDSWIRASGKETE